MALELVRTSKPRLYELNFRRMLPICDSFLWAGTGSARHRLLFVLTALSNIVILQVVFGQFLVFAHAALQGLQHVLII